MYRKLANVIKKLPLVPSYALATRGALKGYGWYRSFHDQRSVDANGRAVPFISYAAFEFLTARVRRDMRVFEYGSGSSTLWWAARVAEVVAVENDPQWYDIIGRQLPENGKLLLGSVADGSYARAIRQVPQGFDVVVVDGRERTECAREALTALSPEGIVIWDDSDRDRYREGIQEILAAGFRELDLVSMGPSTAVLHHTSVLYRDGNCVGL